MLVSPMCVTCRNYYLFFDFAPCKYTAIHFTPCKYTAIHSESETPYNGTAFSLLLILIPFIPSKHRK